MRRLLAPALLLLAAPLAAAQDAPDAEADAVRAAIVGLFDAMQAGDGAAVRDHFHEGAALVSVGRTPGGALQVTGTPVEQFAAVIGGEHALVGGGQPMFDERIGPITVQLDGDLAAAWMPYAFYLGGTFSHCGVNAFHLVRTEAGWKTVRVTDTRRLDGCDPSVAPE